MYRNKERSVPPKFEDQFLFKARKESNTRGNRHEPVHKTHILAYKCSRCICMRIVRRKIQVRTR